VKQRGGTVELLHNLSNRGRDWTKERKIEPEKTVSIKGRRR